MICGSLNCVRYFAQQNQLCTSATDGETVISVMLLHSVQMSLLGRIEAKRMDNEDELDQLLGHYAKGDQMKTLSLETAKLLATTLLLSHSFKHLIQLNQIQTVNA